jgi:NCAIR mutase (PurE)-related protein
MKIEAIRALLKKVKSGKLSVDKAMEGLKNLPFEELHFAKIDHHRSIRTGYPEVVFSQGKTLGQLVMIFERLVKKSGNIMATRATLEAYEAVRQRIPDAVYHEAARIITVDRAKIKKQKGIIAVVSAGTSDIPVAEEAAVTAEKLGNEVLRVYDVGVAGIHRLFASMASINRANVLVVVAGMEGALASVVGGLVDTPVIAVPTSIGYGASFGGLAALLAMLNSCASGVGVVNIDNGFGAGFLASKINKLTCGRKKQ